MIRVSGNLNAKDNVYVPKVYSKKLDELIEDKNTNNIAVTAPYDSGKTTMLKSYFKNKENKYKWYVKKTNKFIDRINRIKKYFFLSRRPSGLRKTSVNYNSLAHKTTWLRSDL